MIGRLSNSVYRNRPAGGGQTGRTPSAAQSAMVAPRPANSTARPRADLLAARGVAPGSGQQLGAGAPAQGYLAAQQGVYSAPRPMPPNANGPGGVTQNNRYAGQGVSNPAGGALAGNDYTGRGGYVRNQPAAMPPNANGPGGVTQNAPRPSGFSSGYAARQAGVGNNPYAGQNLSNPAGAALYGNDYTGRGGYVRNQPAPQSIEQAQSPAAYIANRNAAIAAAGQLVGSVMGQEGLQPTSGAGVQYNPRANQRRNFAQQPYVSTAARAALRSGASRY